MEEQKTSNRGGRREGSGRKSLGKKSVTLKLSQESVEKLSQVPNKSEFVDGLIRKAKISDKDIMRITRGT